MQVRLAIGTDAIDTTSPQRKSAFTLVEVLTVTAIIGVLAAMLFPVFARAREQARRTTCLSNEKQLGQAIALYAQDYDGLPLSRRNDQVPWHDAQMVGAYVKNKSVFKCPSAPDAAGQDNDYGLHMDLFPDDTGTVQSTRQAYQENIIEAPADMIILVEKGRRASAPVDPNFITRQEWWATSVMDDGQYNPVKDNSALAGLPENDKDCVASDTNPANGRLIRFRHSETAVCLFADYHAKAMPKNTIKWFKNIYVAGAYQKSQQIQYPWAPPNPS